MLFASGSRNCRRLLLTTIIAFSAAAIAGYVAAADLEAGHLKTNVCAECHGAYGVSPFPGIPNLAGQKQPYLLKQLKDIRFARHTSPSAGREHRMMSGWVSGLSEYDLHNVAAWYAGQMCADESTREYAAPPAKAERCESCHGTEGRSRNGWVPSLAGQKSAYLLVQLSNFRESALHGPRTDSLVSRWHPLMSVPPVELNEIETVVLANWFSTRSCR